MRNGDYVPTRMDSQADAVNLICNTKTTNPESAVGVMTMASRRYHVLVRCMRRCMNCTDEDSVSVHDSVVLTERCAAFGLRASSPEVLVTPTPGDHAVNKILTALHGVKIEGENHFCSAVQVRVVLCVVG